MQLDTAVGPPTTTSLPAQATPYMRSGAGGELIVQELHGRFYEQNYRGNVFSTAMSDTALIAANASATGVAATSKPIIGLWNSSTTTNLVILQTLLQVTLIANTAVNPAGFNYWKAFNQSAISTGTLGNAVNCKTFAAAGSVATTFTGGNTALTGLVGSLTLLRPVAIGPVLNAAGAGTAVSFSQGACVDNVDGGIIIPPGGLLSIMNLTSTTTVDVTASILWEECPI